jgi:predicted PurR-regulated permease PerM
MSNLLDQWLQIPNQRRKRIVLLIVATVVVAGILWVARGVLGPYVAGLMIAYLLAPMVNFFERIIGKLGEHERTRFFHRLARPAAVVITYLLVIAALVGFFSVGVPMLLQQGRALWEERQIVWDYVSESFNDLIEQYRLLDPRIQTRIEDALANFTTTVGDIMQQAVEGTAVAISYTISFVLAIVVIPFWMFYLLRDGHSISKHIVEFLPPSMRKDILAMVRLFDAAMGSYLRGRLFLGLVIGVVSAIVFTVMGVRFALFLGLVAGIFEMIPSIGPTLGAIPAILVALAQDPTLALWVSLFAFAVQQVENIFLTPQVLGDSVKLHSVVIMVVLIIGSEIAGLVGLFLGPVVTAILRDIFLYVYHRISDEPLSPKEAIKKVREGGTLRFRL